MIYNFNNLAFDLYLQRQELCVISYGGSCSNALVDVLEKNGYRIRTDLWRDILCHCPVYFDMNIPVIYIYDNPIKSLLSMKRRGNNYWGTNQEKLSNNEKIEYSDENLLKLMIRQFKLWTKRKSKNLLVLKSDELFNPNVSNKIKKFLKNMFISDLPLKYKKSKTDISEMLDEERELFSKYKEDIDIINNYK